MQIEPQATCNLHSWSFLGHFTFTSNQELTFKVHILKVNLFFLFSGILIDNIWVSHAWSLCVYTLQYGLNSSKYEMATGHKNTIFQNIRQKLIKPCCKYTNKMVLLIERNIQYSHIPLNVSNPFLKITCSARKH